MTGGLDYRCAVVTGASSGLGAEFARQLAPRCRTLVLIARREARLNELALKLREDHPQLQVEVFAIDLTDPAARQGLISALAAAGQFPDLLVNNAGMGDYGEVAAADWSKTEAMLRLNIEALTAMTQAVVPAMVAAGNGAVLNVSSLACMLPIPDFAVYAASKAYVTSFSEALRLELREHGVRVTALCPGPVHTEFGAIARRETRGGESPFREAFYVEARQVVSEALEGLMEDRARVFPGWKIAAAALLLGVIPMGALRLMMSTRPRR
ncbi:MAG: SDR family NAD(P)-dependent oxidoreductase [Verrucomicrobiales bacterium]